MSLTTEMQGKIAASLKDGYTQVQFFQDQVIILDDDKADWDNAIFKLDSELFGQIQIVNRAIDDVKDAYGDHFTGVTSCRSDLIWVATNLNDTPTPNKWSFCCVKLNENGYTQMMNQLVKENPGGNKVGLNSDRFYYLNPATGIVTSAPTNAVTGSGVTATAMGWDADSFRIGFAPKNYYGLKYYVDPYQLDIGDTFVTSFIGTVNAGSNQLTVMSPVGSTGQDPSMSPVYRLGQIVTCDKVGVLPVTTKINGISTGTADLAQIPTTGAAGVVTTNVSSVNIISLSVGAGLGVSAFDSISFSVLGNPDTGPVGVISDVSSNGEVYKANQQYWAVPSTSSEGGEGATFSVFTDSSGGIAPLGISTTNGGVTVDIIGSGGLGYAEGDTITIAGTSIGMGAGNTANDLTFTVKALQEGRGRFAFKLGPDPATWPNPNEPQTVGIMQTANLGIGGRITLDNSGDPQGAQSWDPSLEGVEIPMDPTNYRILTRVDPPTVGADKSQWKVGFQTAPRSNNTGDLAFEGEYVQCDSNVLGGLLTPLDPCSTDSNTNISNALSSLSTIEDSFNNEDGNNKLLVDATNALREERNELCMRIWGSRTALGDLNNKITRYESLRGYIINQTIEDVIE